jgi:FAD dependent oxidoreductase TIGR03364
VHETLASPSRFDVVVVGAGIVGLAHAYEALLQGRNVAVVDRAGGAVTGASVRNFGHACITPQTGQASVYATEARKRWLDLAALAGFRVRESGTVVVARSAEELAVIEEYVDAGGAAGAGAVSSAVRLDAAEVVARVPVDPDPVVGGAFLPLDLQVDPRQAAPAIATWLVSQGVRFLWRTTALQVESGSVTTSRGRLDADHVVVCTNHDVDRLFPALAEQAGVVRCRLHMLRADVDLRFPLTTPLFTGWSLLRYSGFTAMPSAPALRESLLAALPEGIAWDLNQMVTSPSDGSLVIGDTHLREVDAPPFQDEAGFDLLLAETKRLFGVRDVRVRERWQGVYASAPDQEFLIEEPMPGVHVVTVTTGIGMTTGLGIAPSVLAEPSVLTDPSVQTDPSDLAEPSASSVRA